MRGFLQGKAGERARSAGKYTQLYLSGYDAVTVTPVGNKRGKIILLGTHPLSEDYTELILSVAAECGIMPIGEVSENVVLTERCSKAGRFMCAVEIKNKAGEVVCPFDSTDILTDKSYRKNDCIEVIPNGVLILKENV